MPVVTFATLVVVSHFANARATVEQRIFHFMERRRHRRRNAPQHHFHDRSVVMIDALIEEQLRFHSALYYGTFSHMVSMAIIHVVKSRHMNYISRRFGGYADHLPLFRAQFLRVSGKTYAATAACCSVGNVTVTTVPTFSVLSMRTAAPCRWARPLTSARPRPVPSPATWGLPVSRSNGRPRRSSAGLGIPAPVSRTAISRTSAPVLTEMRTWPPFGVNLTALDSRLIIICFSR